MARSSITLRPDIWRMTKALRFLGVIAMTLQFAMAERNSNPLQKAREFIREAEAAVGKQPVTSELIAFRLEACELMLKAEAGPEEIGKHLERTHSLMRLNEVGGWSPERAKMSDLYLKLNDPKKAEELASQAGIEHVLSGVAQYYAGANEAQEVRRMVKGIGRVAPIAQINVSYHLAVLGRTAATNYDFGLATELFQKALELADSLPTEHGLYRVHHRIAARCTVARAQEQGGMSLEAQETLGIAIQSFKALKPEDQDESFYMLFDGALSIGAFNAAEEVLQLLVQTPQFRAKTYMWTHFYQQLATAEGQSGDLWNALKKVNRLENEWTRHQVIIKIGEARAAAQQLEIAAFLLDELPEGSRNGLRYAIAIAHAKAGRQQDAEQWVSSMIGPAETKENWRQRVAEIKPEPPPEVTDPLWRRPVMFCGTGMLQEYVVKERVQKDPKSVQRLLNEEKNPDQLQQHARRIGIHFAQSENPDRGIRQWRRHMPTKFARGYFYLGLAQGTLDPKSSSTVQ